jgi:peroxiredoxin
MRKEYLALIAALLLLFASFFAFKGELMGIFTEEVTARMFVDKDVDNFDPGLPIAAPFPAIKARYKGEVIDNISQFMGPRGMIFVANRSVDWCPFCMRQLVELQEHVAAFDQAGIGVAVITYDAPDKQQIFTEENDISYPMISDIDASSMMAMDILNTKHQPGEDAYGIPYPGIFVVSPDGVIVGKLFVESYRTRVDARSVLRYAEGKLTFN